MACIFVVGYPFAQFSKAKGRWILMIFPVELCTPSFEQLRWHTIVEPEGDALDVVRTVEMRVITASMPATAGASRICPSVCHLVAEGAGGLPWWRILAAL
jgi:hypothetical protein